MTPGGLSSDLPWQAVDLQQVIDSAPALIHTARPDGHLDFFNRRWLDFAGLSQADLLGWQWIACIHPEDVEVFVEKWRTSIATGEPFQEESRVRRADHPKQPPIAETCISDAKMLVDAKEQAKALSECSPAKVTQ